MKTKKQVNILIAVYYAIIIVAVSFVLNPIYSSVTKDVLTKNTALPGILELFKTALEFLFYTLILSAVIYSNYVSPAKKNLGPVYISAIGITLKYIVNLIFDMLTNGFSSIVSTQILSVCVYIGIEFAQVAVIYTVSRRMIRERNEREKQKKNASRSLGVDYTDSPTLPFDSIFDKNNPLMVLSFIASLLIAIPTITGRLIYDILVVGAPSGFMDGIWIFVYYAFDIISIFIGYLAIIFALTIYAEKSTKAPKENSAN